MENKIQELTDKIYREGVQKGNEEAQRLIEQAQAQANKIVADAQKEAENIRLAAQKAASELTENAQSELKLFAGQSVNALKSEVANMLTGKLTSDVVKGFTQDKESLHAFIVSLASKWSKDEPIVISTSEADTLKQYFTAKAKELLNQGVTIQQVNGQKALFSIAPADGAYKVNFGEEEFLNYFKAFLRPQLVDMLF